MFLLRGRPGVCAVVVVLFWGGRGVTGVETGPAWAGVGDALDPREGRGMRMEPSLSPRMAGHKVWLATTWTCGSIHGFSVRRGYEDSDLLTCSRIHSPAGRDRPFQFLGRTHQRLFSFASPTVLRLHAGLREEKETHLLVTAACHWLP